VGDLNGDGNQDLVWLPFISTGGIILAPSAYVVMVALGTGPAAFAAPLPFSYSPSMLPYGPAYGGLLEVEDLDGDGLDDVIVYVSNGSMISLQEGIFVL
jgi:hypothetical protein